MKVTVENAEEKEPLKFPCLMIATSGLIVLFTKSASGTVVGNPRQSQQIGYTCSGFGMEFFKPFHGTVTLQND